MKKNTANIKAYLSTKLHRGVHAIRLLPQAVKRLNQEKGTPTRVQARAILKARELRVIPKAKRSYKIIRKDQCAAVKERLLASHTPFKIRKTHLSDLLKNKTISDKQRWSYHVRQARALIKSYRSELAGQYRTYYKRVKGGFFFKRITELKRQLAAL